MRSTDRQTDRHERSHNVFFAHTRASRTPDNPSTIVNHELKFVPVLNTCLTLALLEVSGQFQFRPLYCRYPLDMKLGGPQSRSGCGARKTYHCRESNLDYSDCGQWLYTYTQLLRICYNLLHTWNFCAVLIIFCAVLIIFSAVIVLYNYIRLIMKLFLDWGCHGRGDVVLAFWLVTPCGLVGRNQSFGVYTVSIFSPHGVITQKTNIYIKLFCLFRAL
jgi:hypothetical protein